MWGRFKTCLPGKWVLVGEHTVMRGGTAIVFPYPRVSLCLEFAPLESKGLTVRPADAAPVVDELFKIYEDRQGSKIRFSRPTGELTIRSAIPQRAGLGSSAALCVAVARWIGAAMGIPVSEVADAARVLENHFHGDSSGMDIAAVLADKPIVFEKGRAPQPLNFDRFPHFTLHDTGRRSSAADSISRVKVFIAGEPDKAASIDQAMNAASRQALTGLQAYGNGEDQVGLEAVAEGMRMALNCFGASAWNLLPEAEQLLIESLLASGALAAKPTGAGGGGMVLALWPEPAHSKI